MTARKVYTGLGGIELVSETFTVPDGTDDGAVQVAVGNLATALAVGDADTWLTPDEITIDGTSCVAGLLIGNGHCSPTTDDYVLWYRVVSGEQVIIQPSIAGVEQFRVVAVDGDSVDVVGPFVLTINGEGPDADGNVDVEAGGGDVSSVNGVTPDVDGNIEITASDVGADTAGAAAAAQSAAESYSDAALAAHVSDATDAHDASAISFVPTGSIASTDVQAAVAEVASEAATALSSEASTRSSADTTNANAITAEAATARAAESANATAITNETSRATTAEALLAPKISPALTGTPTTPTASPGTGGTQIASQAYADAAVAAATLGLLDLRGGYNASGNTFPSTGGSGSSGAVVKGDLWYITTPGTLGGTAVTNGDQLVALTDTPGQTAANWAITEHDFGYTPLNAASNLSDVGNASTSRTNIGLGNVDNTSDASKPVSTAQQAALDLKAPLASPALTGNPTAPTQSAGNNSTRLASTAYADGAVASEASARSAADALLAPLASPALTGNPTVPTQASGNNSTRAASTAFVADAVSGLASKLTRTAVKTSSYAAALWDLVPCDASGGAITITLPAASGGKGLIAIKATVAGTVNLALTGTDHFNTSAGPTTGSITLANQGIILASDGSGIWTVIADDIPLSVLDARYVPNPATADVSLGSHKLTSVTPGTASTDAATVSQIVGFGVYGDGSDGAITFDGTTTVLGMVPSAGVYTLTRALWGTTITINSGVVLIANGCHIFCDTLVNNGTIRWNGTAATSAAGAANMSNGTGTITNASPNGPGGNSAATAPSTAGTGITISIGGSGGAGGAGAGGAGAAGGTATQVSGGGQLFRAIPWSQLGGVFAGGNNGFARLAGGAGGGGGTGDGAGGQGGGGGAGGGIVVVCARLISGTGAIEAKGGAGANGGANNRGGGGGGGGGVVFVTSSSVAAGAVAGQTISAAGGAGGTGGGGSGVTGSTGSAGTVILVRN